MLGLRSSSRCATRERLLTQTPRRTRPLRLAALAAGVMIGGVGTVASSALAASTPMVDLGQASSYAVISGASVGNVVSAAGAPYTVLRGDLGVKVATEPTGFPPGIVTGTKQIGTPAAVGAHADLVAAYAEVAARTGGSALAGALAGTTILPGLHTVAGAVSNTTTVTLDGGGDPNAVFVFQVGGALAMAAGSHVVLTNGAQASRVFWQVNGAGAVGANSDFAGTLMALDAVAMGNGTTVNGRAFARNGALTLDNNQFYSSPPVVTVTGGAGDITTDTTPTISGTTDVEAPGVVTVTVAGQLLTVTPSGGAWSVTSAPLANGVYPVVASVVDAAGNTGSATQQLTVDTVLPVVSIDGGPSMLTNDATPTIDGTSDVATGTVVHVTVGAQERTALVQTDGTWNVTPSTLTDATRTVTATVSDPAGNLGTDSQALTVDTTAPAVTIAGGATALTNDATPRIYGTAAVAPGTVVTVYVANEALTGLVGAGGSWGVTAAALANGPHRVSMRVSDAAGNRTGFVQMLTVDTVSPTVTITGGATESTEDLDPTIAGTADTAPGTTVTVTIAGQTMTAILQAGGTWNTTPNVVTEGTWTVVASATDPAGNVGSATQTLTIALPDETPPTTTDDVPAGSVTANVRVTLTAIDADPGVAATYYTTGVNPTYPPTAQSARYDPTDKPLLHDGERIRYFSADTLGNTEAAKTSDVAHVTPVNLARPAISGTAKVGSILSVTTGSWDNSPTGYAYAWKRCTTATTLESCTTIAGANQATYALAAADDVRYLRSFVTATNASGSAEQYSNATAKVTYIKPFLLARPVVSGTLTVGETLSASTGTWENLPTGYAYTWKRCIDGAYASCSVIAGATGATYTLVPADDTRYMRVSVTATNSGGSTLSITSNATARITYPKPVLTARPVISGTPMVGQTLTVNAGSWDNLPTSYAYTWQRCSDGTLSSCTNIAGATQSTYQPVSADLTRYLRVSVTAINSGGSTLSPRTDRTPQITAAV